MQAAKIDIESTDPRQPFLNLMPIVDVLVEHGNAAQDAGFVWNPEGWTCQLIRQIDFDLVRRSFELPPSIVLSEQHDAILDRRSWISIESPKRAE